MRTQHGPNKSLVPLPHPPFVSACIVTHYTDHVYHKDRMEVVRLCLDSMIAGLQGSDYELLIWDNGSTTEFRELLRSYNPTVLIESVNVGAHNARHYLADIARGEILCMADDDIVFHPEFLSLQLEILSIYPNVGLVSGSPYRAAFTWGQSPQLPADIKVTRGDLIPGQWIMDACASVGQDYASAMWGLKGVDDVLLEYNGIKAWNHGHHMQLTAKRDIIKPFFEKSPYFLAHGRKLNEEIMTAGFLQLTSFRRTALHIGNLVDKRIVEIYAEWNGKK